jgi:hypothetical protein
MKMKLRVLIALLLTFSVGSAQADWISVYASGKFDRVTGTGDVFENLDPGFAGGVEAGIELIGIDLWGEAIWMANQQAMYSANLGFDLTFGSDLRLNLGLYTGPIFFQMGEAKSEGVTLSSQTNEILNQARMADPNIPSASEIETAYNSQFGAQSGQLDSIAFGWNLARARVQVEYQIMPFGYIGLGGQYGHHLTISGDNIKDTATNYAIEELANSDDLKDMPAELKEQFITQLKQDLGVEETSKDDLSGNNFNFGLYLKLEI